jgi:hypothetical protein
MPKVVEKFVLKPVGIALALFCLYLAIVGAIRFHGWIEVGRFAPPHYPGIERFPVISFKADPLNAALEIGGNLLFILMALSGIVVVIQLFRRGAGWITSFPFALPPIVVFVFLSTVWFVLAGRTDLVLPVALFEGAIVIAADRMLLRHTPTVRDSQKL